MFYSYKRNLEWECLFLHSRLMLYGDLDMNTEFSVLMSVYFKDSPKFLWESLNSVLNQTLMPKEIVLVVDGNVPNELNQCISKLVNKHPIIKVVRLKVNRGLGAALAEGTKYITTDYIARMDADDISVNDRFEKQLKIFSQSENIGIVGSQIAEFEGSVDKITSYRQVPFKDFEIRNFAKKRSPFNHPSVIIKKSFLAKAGGYLTFAFLEDYYLWVRLLAIPGMQAVNHDEILVYMRVDQGMFARRGGVKYLRSYSKFKIKCLKKGYISFIDCSISIFLMVISSIFPTFLRKKMYKSYLRK